MCHFPICGKNKWCDEFTVVLAIHYLVTGEWYQFYCLFPLSSKIWQIEHTQISRNLIGWANLKFLNWFCWDCYKRKNVQQAQKKIISAIKRQAAMVLWGAACFKDGFTYPIWVDFYKQQKAGSLHWLTKLAIKEHDFYLENKRSRTLCIWHETYNYEAAYLICMWYCSLVFKRWIHKPYNKPQLRDFTAKLQIHKK